ncbi:MAG: hypothetical protein NVS1B10_08510 [Candidatus Saccharimonadales bacterium]
MTYINRHPEFPIEEWENAPQYWGPGTRELQEHARVTVLDFERLQMLAELQRDRGAFKPDNGTDVQKAPVKVGPYPASFVSVESLGDDDYLLHRPFEVEILVVLNGILEIERSQPPSMPRAKSQSRGILRQGDAVGLRPGEVQLTAHGLDSRASSLALSILGLVDKQMHFITKLSRTSMQKEFDIDFKPDLPYDPAED